MLNEGLAHLLATDAHHIDKRPPLLTEAREAAAKRVGDAETVHQVLTKRVETSTIWHPASFQSFQQV